MRFFTTHGPRRSLRASWGWMGSATLGLLLLSGCGGGSSSSTNEGFRFVPEGSGAVSPDQNHALTFYYNQGSVISGVIVTAQDATTSPTVPTAPPGADTPPTIAFQIGLSQPSVAFSTAARVVLPKPSDPAVPGQKADPRIYLYQLGAWQILPKSTADIGTSATQIEAILPGSIANNSYVAVYTSSVPSAPTATQIP